MNPNQPRHRGWRTKEEARKRKHDVPAPPIPVAPPAPMNPVAPPPVIPAVPPPPRSPQPDLMFYEDVIGSSRMQARPSTSSVPRNKGKSVATPSMSHDTITISSSSATTKQTSDGDFVPPPSFDYDDEVQSRYTAHRVRAGKAKVVESSSQAKKGPQLRGGRKSSANPSLFDARSPLPKPKPQVLGLVSKRAQEYAFGKDLKKRYFPDSEDLVFLLKDDHLY